MKVGYVRVSDHEQTLNLQVDALTLAGCDAIYGDHGVSGCTVRRKGLDEVLTALQSGDTLVVWKLDRLSRSLKDLLSIMEKIDADPESTEIKSTERHLWEKIREMCIKGRRTGVGITAEGDMLAALGLQYGSDEAIDFAVKVHQTLALNAYRSSVDMAKERGGCPIFNAAKEKNNPFINRLKDADPQFPVGPPDRFLEPDPGAIEAVEELHLVVLQHIFELVFQLVNLVQ